MGAPFPRTSGKLASLSPLPCGAAIGYSTGGRKRNLDQVFASPGCGFTPGDLFLFPSQKKSSDGKVQRMVPFIEQIMFALMLSSTYALISVGFTLFFGAINIVHFSHGDVAMLGSFVGIILYGLLAFSGVMGVLPFWAAV